MKTLRTNRRAFTLAETLLALGLILLLMGALYTFSSQVAASRKHLEQDSTRHRTLTDVLDSIERAGLTSLAGDAALGAGVSGNATSLSIVSRAGGELVKQQWKFDAGAGNVQVVRTTVQLGEGAESPPTRATSSEAQAPASGTPETWSTGLQAIKFRYLVGSQWRETFDSLAQGGLPQAIEVQAWFTPASAPAAPSIAASDASEPLMRAPDRRRLIVVDSRMPEGTVSSSAGGRTP